MKRIFYTTFTWLLLAGAASGHEYRVGPLEIGHPWSRPAAAAGNGVVYFTLANSGAEADRLEEVTVAGEVAKAAGLHTSAVDAQGVATMRPVQSVEIPAGGAARLSPGGTHVMLVGLRQPLREGHSFKLTLGFAKAGPVTVDVAVERKPSHGEAGDHEHMNMAP